LALIDLLVEVGPTTSSWLPAGLVLDLQDLLGCRVEIVTERAINPAIRERVLPVAVGL
jgi:predicted nucleotidyltransferase